MKSTNSQSNSAEHAIILIFSGNQHFFEPLTALLERIEIQIHYVSTAPSVLESFEKYAYPLVIVDADGSDLESRDLVTTIRKSFPDCAVIVIATHPSAELLTTLLRAGIYDFLNKPVDFKQLSSIIRYVCQKHLITEAKVEVLDRLKSSTALLDHSQVELYQQAFRINDELKNVNAALKRHVSQLTILYQMGRDISENENWNDALDRFLMALVKYMNAEGAAVLLFSNNEKCLSTRSSFQVEEDLLKSSCEILIEQWKKHPRGSEMHCIESYKEGVFDTCLERISPWNITLIPFKHRNRFLGFILLEKKYILNHSFKIDYYFLNTIQTIFAEEVANASYISELRQLSRFNENVLDNINSGVITTDTDGMVRFFNKQAKSLCSQLGKSMVIHFNDLFKSYAYGDDFFNKIIHSNKDIHILEVECRMGDERISPVRLSTSNMFDDNLSGNVIVAIFEDLTEQKRLEAEIRKNDRLRALGQLSASVAHEIRNPLTGIATSVEVLGNKLRGEGDKVKYIHVVLDEINRLDGIIRNLLNFAKPIKPRFALCSLPEITSRVVNILSEQAKKKGITLEVKSELAEESCYVDADQITQVFLNIAINAVQACNKDDFIEFILKNEKNADYGDKIFTRIDVVDSGPGVPETIRENIFEPFVTSKAKGSGLGLAISQQIIEEHGGKILFDCQPGKTTFSILLPSLNQESVVGITPHQVKGN